VPLSKNTLATVPLSKNGAPINPYGAPINTLMDMDIYNIDKTGFMMGIIASGMVIIGIEKHQNPKKVQPGNREWVIAIQSINTKG
jgi:hypothetical protein